VYDCHNFVKYNILQDVVDEMLNYRTAVSQPRLFVSPSSASCASIHPESLSRQDSRLGSLRDRFKSAKAPYKLLAQRPQSARTTSAVRSVDEVDEVVQNYLAETNQVGRLARQSYGVYLLGNKRIGISVKNGKPLVRIGGGAMIHLDLYLVNHA
jgi:hypothetical protein